MKLPTELKPLFWSAKFSSLDPQKDEVLIIHTVMSLGDLNDIKWLMRFYGRERVKRVFLDYPYNVYSAPVFYFIKNILLGLKNEKIDPKLYIKHVY